MNPHFIFNCLNSVQRFIIGNDAEGANEYLSTFANLIRQTLENSGKKLIPLKDELRYLETYIKMEQLRSNNKFDYDISIGPEVDQTETYIPNMIVQPYVENSIHHGMLHTKNQKGYIKLDISKGNKLNFTINDNGAGINNKNIIQPSGDTHHSMGGAITEKRIAMYNSLHENKIELEVLDKADTGSRETGTSVILKFPLNN
jgi:LytS/YehU family sensor histidine kinase